MRRELRATRHPGTEPGASEARLRTVIEQCPLSVHVSTPEGRSLLANGAWNEFWDLEEGPEGTNVFEDDRLRAAGLVPYIERGAAGVAVTTPPLLYDPGRTGREGHARWLQASIHPVKDEDGGVLEIALVLEDVTERKEAEDGLREAEERYRTLVEQVPVAVYRQEVEHDGAISYMSPQIQSITGYLPEEYVTDPGLWVRTTHPEDRERVLAEDERTDKTGEPFRVEFRKITRDGRVIWVRDEAVLVRDQRGEPLYWQGVVSDITERRETEGALRESEARFRSLIQNASDIITILEADGTVRYESPSIERVLGYRPEEMVGAAAFDYVHPDDRERVLESFSRKVEKPGEMLAPMEFRVRHKDGSWRYLEVVGNNLLEDPGVRGIVVNSRDITERKLTEERLRAAETSYRRLVEQVPVVVYTEDVDAPITLYDSPRIEEMLGYPQDTYLKDPRYWEKILHPDDRERVLADEARAREEGAFTLEYRVIARDGRVVWLRDEAALVRDEEGNPLYWQGVQFDITERKVLEERLEHQAFHDDLTGLPNRALFMDRLEQALARLERRREPVTVLFMDLDNFKVVNDSLGHECGDRLLVEVAGRLTECVRPEDTVARFGGDEFTVLLEGISDVDGAVRVVERISEALQAPFRFKEREVFVNASVGIAPATATPEDADNLLRKADQALYAAKKKGKNHHEVFDPDAAEADRPLERLEFESALRGALERAEFEVYYQPKISLQSGRVVSFEALVRWAHPERGLLEPEAFFPVAKETGLIVPIGEWALGEACRQGRAWQERCADLSPPVTAPRVCVNLSPEQFMRSDLLEKVTGTLKESGLEARNLSLEVAEIILTDDADSAVGKLQELRELEIHIVVDGFGAALSSLSDLKRLPLNLLKLDRSLIRRLGEEPGDTAIVAAMINLAHDLGWAVTAHGVETAEQLARLRALGCDVAQGYYLSRPVTGEEASALLETNFLE